MPHDLGDKIRGEGLKGGELRAEQAEEIGALSKLDSTAGDGYVVKDPTAPNPQLHFLGLADGLGRICGKEKYLGGVLQPLTNTVYNIPGHAKQVLKIADGGSSTYLPTPKQFKKVFDQKFKWLRGACVDETCYGIPSWADQVLCISKDDNITLKPIKYHDPRCTGDGTNWKWHGGVVTKKKHVIGVPGCSNCVLKIDYDTGEAKTFGDVDLISDDLSKWFGGILAEDDCVYCMPQQANCVLKICPNTEQVWRIYGDTPEHEWVANQYSWHGGVYSSKDGCIYAIPNHENRGLRLDPFGNEGNGKLTLFGGPEVIPNSKHRSDGKYKYFGGVMCQRTGHIYCVPGDADQILKIVPPPRDRREEEAQCILIPQVNFSTLIPDNPHSVGMDQNKWQNGFYNKKDECIYTIPLKGQKILKIHTRPEKQDQVELLGDEHVVVHQLTRGGDILAEGAAKAELDAQLLRGKNPLVGTNKWEGGVMDTKGNMYCCPMFSGLVLKIVAEKY